jgi:hypothetical protein
MRFPLLVLLSLVVVGCTKEPSPAPEGISSPVLAGNHLPVVHEATVLPVPLILDGLISVQIHADDPDRDPVTFHYQWVVNGHLLEDQTGPLLLARLLKQGDKVSVEIFPDDGKARGAVYRTPVSTVVNTPPIISSLSVSPEPGIPGDKLEARAEATDPDADPIDLSFRWWRNGAVVKEGDDPTLDTSGFLVKDMVLVEVTPRDRKAAGKAVKSGPLFASNGPPAITSTPSVPTAGTQFEYMVKAVDPEGDPVSYRLETAPPGMVIDEETGHIHWPLPAGQQGTFHVKVVALDGQGGTAHQEFDLTLPAPAPAKPQES